MWTIGEMKKNLQSMIESAQRCSTKMAPDVPPTGLVSDLEFGLDKSG